MYSAYILGAADYRAEVAVSFELADELQHTSRQTEDVLEALAIVHKGRQPRGKAAG